MFFSDPPFCFRKWYHVNAYFMFLFTIATGLVASLFRILQGVFFGLIYLGRCDKCVLMSGFESMDRGKYFPSLRVTQWSLKSKSLHCKPLLPLTYEVWDKVMFSLASVSLFTGVVLGVWCREGCGVEEDVCLRVFARGYLPWGVPPPPRWLLPQAVRILLEYILVYLLKLVK